MQGHMDSPLTELGVRQAEWLRQSLVEVALDAIHSSSSPRAIHTAERLAEGRSISVSTDDRLKEIQLGNWEGLRKEEVKRDFPTEHFAFWNTPHLYEPGNGGETFHELRDRVIPAIGELLDRNKGKTILVVTHAASLKMIMAHFQGMPMSALWEPPYIQPTALCKVLVDGEYFRIEMHGDVSHFREDG